jgi:hypothetical protein
MYSDRSRAPEPRVHFALSLCCASSPRIRVYRAETLDDDLQEAACEYVHQFSAKQRVRRSRDAVARGLDEHEVVLPKIFKMCAADFGHSKQEILAYYASFLPDAAMEELITVFAGVYTRSKIICN